jgi:hypothetical protein
MQKIILNVLLMLRKDVDNKMTLAFDLMPKLFTLTELQNVFEIVLGRKLLTANFRRKIADYVLETEQFLDGVSIGRQNFSSETLKDFTDDFVFYLVKQKKLCYNVKKIKTVRNHPVSKQN